MKWAKYYCPSCRKTGDRYMEKTPAKLKSWCNKAGKPVWMRKLKASP